MHHHRLKIADLSQGEIGDPYDIRGPSTLQDNDDDNNDNDDKDNEVITGGGEPNASAGG